MKDGGGRHLYMTIDDDDYNDDDNDDDVDDYDDDDDEFDLYCCRVLLSSTNPVDSRARDVCLTIKCLSLTNSP